MNKIYSGQEHNPDGLWMMSWSGQIMDIQRHSWSNLSKRDKPYDPNGPWISWKHFADAGYQSDPHSAKSQTGYVFTYGGTAISWRSVKQTISATSSNHSEILAIHEASRECVWLRLMTHHIRTACGITDGKDEPTVLYEDNAACIAQLKDGYIKGDKTKHVLPKFFFTHDLQKEGEVKVLQVRSSENSADLFTKALPTCTLRKLMQQIGMRSLRSLQWCSLQGK